MWPEHLQVLKENNLQGGGNKVRKRTGKGHQRIGERTACPEGWSPFPSERLTVTTDGCLVLEALRADCDLKLSVVLSLSLLEEIRGGLPTIVQFIHHLEAVIFKPCLVCLWISLCVLGRGGVGHLGRWSS